LRRRHPWLHHARTKPVHLSNEQFAYEASDGTHKLVVALSVGAASAELPVPYGKSVLHGTAELKQAGSAQAAVVLPPHGWAVLEA
jgi:cyclomaltodextrinase